MTLRTKRQPAPTLFAPVARSHRADPETSKDAARHMNRSGKAKSHESIVVAAVKKYPDATSGELARRIDVLDLAEVRRRLTDAERRGLVEKTGRRRCGELGSNQSTWGVV